MLEKGIKGTNTVKVTDDMTAIAVGSGGLPVFATPAMIALMERTAYESVIDKLDEGQGLVGISMDVEHKAAVGVGREVTCETVLKEIDGRKLEFDVKVYDDEGIIGEGEHERYIIDVERFMGKVRI